MENQRSATMLPIVLKGNNFVLWSRTTTTALKSRGLWSYVEAQEEVKAKDAKWEQEDQQVLALLQTSLDPSILAAYSHCVTAKELWDQLKGVFGDTSNLSKIFEVKKALNDLAQEGKAFKDHFGTFRSLWAELEMLRPSTVDAAVLRERMEQDQVFGLLLTLNNNYKDLIQHVLRYDKLPTLTEVCALIQKEEGARSLFKTPNEMVHLAQRSMGQGERRTFYCDHCKRKGHSKERCWSLHPNLRPTQQRSVGQSSGQNGQGGGYPRNFVGQATVEANDYIRKGDLEAFFNGLMKQAGKDLTFKSFLMSKAKREIIVDSGATNHMICDKGLLKEVEPYEGKVLVADGKAIDIEGIGDLELMGKKTSALFIPNLSTNLVSVHKCTKDLGCDVIFGVDGCEFQDHKTREVIGLGRVEDGLYKLEKKEDVVGEVHLVNKDEGSHLSHLRLGHPSKRVQKMVFPNQEVLNLDCEACVLGKHSRSSFPNSSTLYKECFELVHSDVWTAPCNSSDQCKYFVSFIDQKSKYTWIKLLRHKGEVQEAFMDLYSQIETQYNQKIKCLRSDNGGEYMGNSFRTFLKEKGILHQTSCAYTPQQNGVSERKNRHLLEVTRSLMFERGVPKRFWGYALETAVYLINRLPTRHLDKISPYEVLNGEKPEMDGLRVFGCKCYVLLPEIQRDKLEPKSLKCMFIGYSNTQKGWRCLHLETSRVHTSREVKFVEEEGCFNQQEWEELDGFSIPHMEETYIPREETSSNEIDGEEAHREILADVDPREVRDEEEGLSEEEEENNEVQILRRSQRLANVPRVQYNYFAEEECLRDTKDEHLTMLDKEYSGCTASLDLDPIGNGALSLDIGQVAPLISTSACNLPRYPIGDTYTLENMSKEDRVFAATLEGENLPKSYEEACEDPRWIKAMEEEIESMNRNGTWDMVELPQGKKLVGCRWVYTIKYKSDGTIERYKARLVAKGYTQVYGEDYTETFAPVAKLHSIRVLLSIAINLSWELWQMDVKNAFLQGELDEEVFMSPPLGYEDKGRICKLNKAIYGLKQSPRAWYHRLSSCLVKEEFTKAEADHTMFYKNGPNGIVIILVYVDDIIITGSAKEEVTRAKRMLKDTFDIKDLGELKYFLGIEMIREEDGLFISQRKYTLDLLKETGKLASKPAKTPIEDGYKDEKEEEMWADVKQYQRLVGKLIYLTITRPDISFAVNRVSQHMQTPKKHHWNMVERILRYLKGGPGKGIYLKKNGHTQVEVYCDADWAGDTMDRKSTTGYCTFVGGNLVTWRSKKQKIIALSSAEAEYRAMKEVTKEAMWLHTFLSELGLGCTLPINLYCDNQAAIHIASNPVFHERTKHIEVDCHFVRSKIQDGLIVPRFVRSGEQMADVFTKATSASICEYIHGKIGLHDPLRPILRGSVEPHDLEHQDVVLSVQRAVENGQDTNKLKRLEEEATECQTRLVAETSLVKREEHYGQVLTKLQGPAVHVQERERVTFTDPNA